MAKAYYPLHHDEYLTIRSKLKPNELDIYLYLITKHPFKDSKLEIDTALISERLGYHRRTVQLAINKLVSLHFLKVEITKFKYQQAKHGHQSRIIRDSESVDRSSCHTKVIRESVDRQGESVDRQGESVDRQGESVDRQGESVDRQGESVDRQPPSKPASDNGSSSSQTNKTNKTNKTLSEEPSNLDSLSEEEREKFSAFCLEKANQLPSPPVLVEKWISKHRQELEEAFKREYRTQTNQSKITYSPEEIEALWTKRPNRKNSFSNQQINSGSVKKNTAPAVSTNVCEQMDSSTDEKETENTQHQENHS